MPVPATFIARVKDVLDHLYDLPYLSECQLARELLPARLPTGVSRAHALRQAILEAIDELHQELPGGRTSRPARTYHILDLRYVESFSYQEVMSELGLSQPQYHREQRRAVEALATLLWEEHQRGPNHEGALAQPESSDAWADDLQAVAQGPEAIVDLADLVGGVVALLEGVARASEVTLRSDATGAHVLIDVNRTVLRQLLIAAISFVLRGVHGGQLIVTPTLGETSARVEVTYRGEMIDEKPRAERAREHWTEGERLLGLLKGSWVFAREAEGATLAIRFPRRVRTLLVIDDNPDMVQLIARFVSGQGYVVVEAGSVDEGIALARQRHPSTIVLDIMMPGRDGWDALQALTNHPATQRVPVLVCTILAESELALTLGAQGFLRKPITRSQLLESLRRCAR